MGMRKVWRNRLRPALAALLAVGTAAILMQALPERADAAGETAGADGVYRIVALGDSLAAGYEYGMEKQANPVPYGFVERVWEQTLIRGYRAEFSNYGIIGLRTEGLEKLLARAERGEGSGDQDLLAEGQEAFVDPRINSLVGDGEAVRRNIERADLILIQVGGNDFINYALALDAGRTKEADDMLTDILDRIGSSLETSVRTIHRINPDALVVIGDQFSPVPKKILNREIAYYDKLQDAVKLLTDRLEELSARFAAEDRDVRVAHSAGRFVGKELTMTTMLAAGIQGERSAIHPNQNGYDAMGRAFAEAVWGEYREPSPREEDVPITIFVNGKELKPGNAKPLVRNSYTFLVLRDIADALKADLAWDNKTKSATFTLKGRKVVLTPGSSVMTVNGEPRTIPAAPFAEGGRTYVPLGALSDALGFDVVYRNTLKTAFING
jgi:GDSL-like Lipase/Acylhydrolase./Copper amine oxidase N-terminal domain.